MKRKYHKKVLRLEHLERRALLAGIVAVGVSESGDLSLVGDEYANVVTVRALPRQGAFEVVPDAETSINGMAPGKPLQVAGVRRDIILDMGNGDDQVAISGRPATRLRSLNAEMGAGNDELHVRQLRLSDGLEASSESGIDVISLRQIRSNGAIRVETADADPEGGNILLNAVHIEPRANKATPILMLSCSSGSHIQLEDLNLTGDVQIESDGSVDLETRRLRVDGNVNLHSAGGRVDVNQTRMAEEVNFNFAKIKVDYTGAENSGESSVNIQNSRLGRLTVESRGQHQFAIVDSKITNNLTIPPQASKASPALMLLSSNATEATLENVRIAGNVLIESDRDVQVNADQVDVEGSVELISSGGAVEASGINLNYEEIKVTYKEMDSKAPRSAEDGGTQDGGMLSFSSSVFGKVSVNSLGSSVDLRLKDSTADSIEISSQADNGGARSSDPINRIDIENSYVGSLAVDADNGLDVRIANSRVQDALRLVSEGDFEDTLELSHSELGGPVFVSLAEGSDQARIHDSVFGDSVFFDGGDGEEFDDVLSLCNNRFQQNPDFSSWEEVLDACAGR